MWSHRGQYTTSSESIGAHSKSFTSLNNVAAPYRNSNNANKSGYLANLNRQATKAINTGNAHKFYDDFKKNKSYELRKEDMVYAKGDESLLPLEIAYLLYARNIDDGTAIKAKLENLRPFFYDRVMSILSHHTIRSLMSYPRVIEMFLDTKLGDHDLLGAIEGNAFLNEVYLCRDEHEKSMKFYKKHEKNIKKLVKCVLAVDELDGESDILEKEIGRLNEFFAEGTDFKALLDHNHEAFFSEYLFTDDNRKVNVHLIRTLADERRQIDKKK